MTTFAVFAETRGQFTLVLHTSTAHQRFTRVCAAAVAGTAGVACVGARCLAAGPSRCLSERDDCCQKDSNLSSHGKQNSLTAFAMTPE